MVTVCPGWSAPVQARSSPVMVAAPVVTGVPSIEVVTSELYAACASTPDRSSAIEAGFSTVAPVLVPVTVYSMVCPGSTTVPAAGLELLATV